MSVVPLAALPRKLRNFIIELPEESDSILLYDKANRPIGLAVVNNSGVGEIYDLETNHVATVAKDIPISKINNILIRKKTGFMYSP